MSDAKEPIQSTPRTLTVASKVTIRDVAAAAHVSIATVSRALRGHDTVTPATRERVQRAVDELHFTPSRLGRSLAEQRHAANGIVFPDLSGPYYAEVILGYEAVASDLERSVVILSTHGRAAPRDRVLDLAGRVDGMVLISRTVSDHVVLEVVGRGVPVVVLAREPIRTHGSGENDGGTTSGEASSRQSVEAAIPIDSVNTDNATSATDLANHLLAQGIANPVFVGTVASSPDVLERWTALAEAFRAGGVDELPVLPAELSEPEGRRVARALLPSRAWPETRGASGAGAFGAPDALVCANDELALGVLNVLRAEGVRVPEDVVVTGWDDLMAARWAGLTTVTQPMRELGATAARRLDARINGDLSAAQHIRLSTELVIRETTHAPSRGS